MSHAYARNYVHLIFSTRERRKCIVPVVQAKLWEKLVEISRDEGFETLVAGGTADHVHVLVSLAPRFAVASVVRVLKAKSSRWMNDTGHLFSWQEGYGAFSVSHSNLPSVTEFIQNQQDHHGRRTFEDEYRAILKKHGVEFSEERVFG
jgi:REP element-mobilizing transposase RayT